ncbi:2-C-methyl-D-erythritol 4-phosphate cytidylyltransferase [Lachnospiraceae bacterium]|nr:2-C-methyl-D-erythritol 4-phosphate cytidylyltransferase [Lachnospiraceae bacterium]
MVQTPQVFNYSLIRDAYHKLIQQETKLQEEGVTVTDDAMVVETLTGHPVKLVLGSYVNVKITTPEDISIVENFLER